MLDEKRVTNVESVVENTVIVHDKVRKQIQKLSFKLPYLGAFTEFVLKLRADPIHKLLDSIKVVDVLPFAREIVCLDEGR